MQAHTNYKVLVDLPLFTPITGNEKIIFSRKEKNSIFLKIKIMFKKIFMQKEMQEAAAMRIKNIFDAHANNDNRYSAMAAKINVQQGIDESTVIDAFEDVINQTRLNKILQASNAQNEIPKNLPIEVEELITQQINNPSSNKLKQDMIYFAKQKIFMLMPTNDIEKHLKKFEDNFPDNLNELKLNDFQKLGTIFTQCLKLSPNNEDAYVNDFRKHINDRLAIVQSYLDKLTPTLES
jgi:hypothetical protein